MNELEKTEDQRIFDQWPAYLASKYEERYDELHHSCYSPKLTLIGRYEKKLSYYVETKFIAGESTRVLKPIGMLVKELSFTGIRKRAELPIAFELKEAEKKKKQIAEALVFGMYLETVRETHGMYRTGVLLHNYFLEGQKNPYIALWARIELLPLDIWRRLLWRENIDFLSFESFFRRLTFAQGKAIEENFEACERGEIPPVLKVRLIDRAKLFLGGKTKLYHLDGVDMTHAESYNNEEDLRYRAKGAWVEPFLHIDFGFSLYPKGIHSDERADEGRFSKFLAKKEHENDFVMNKEDGIYYWLYRKARSNFAMPFGKIEVKKAVCPGFWFTLIAHTIFWILSPIFFSIFFPQWLLSSKKFMDYLPMVLSSVTPLWLMVAFLRLIIMNLGKLFRIRDGIIAKFFKRLLIAIAISVASIAVYYSLVYGVFYLSYALNPMLSFFIIVTIYFYVVAIFLKNYDNSGCSDYYDDIPESLWAAAWMIDGLAGAILLYKYVLPYILKFLVYMAGGIWEMFLSAPLLVLWYLISGTFAVFAIIKTSKIDDVRSEQKFASQDRFLRKIMLLYTAITIAIIGIGGVVNWDVIKGSIIPVVSFCIVGLVGWLVLNYFTSRINTKTIDVRLNATHWTEILRKITGDHYGIKTEYSIRNTFMYNQFFAGLSQEEGDRIINLVFLSVKQFFHYNSDATKAMKELIWFLDKDLVKVLSGLKREDNMSDNIKWDIFRLLLEGKAKNVKDAEKLRMEEIARRRLLEKKNDEIKYEKEKRSEERWERIARFFRPIGRPFRAIGKFFSQIGELWEMFNERCPIIKEQEPLNF